MAARQTDPISSGAQRVAAWHRRACRAGMLLVLTAILTVCGLAGSQASANDQSLQLPEYRIKAVFLFNFARFVEWPEAVFDSSDAPIVIGVLGPDPFGDELEQIVTGKKINERPLLIRRSDRVTDLLSCQILFISTSVGGSLAHLLPQLEGHHLLTVGESSAFAERGGVVQFTMQANRVRFAFNLDVADREGLKISSKLLRLAASVHRDSASTGSVGAAGQ